MASIPILCFDHVSKIFPDGTRAVDDVAFEIAEGECVTFVGPSGCGKTTTVKLLNRLVEPTSGRILLNGEDTASIDVIALRRGIGYVIQDVGLFPHMTVAQNIALVPRLIRWTREAQARRTDELLHLVGLDPLAFRSRYPHQLSGGQRQRVGVARGLAADPPVILMDEPFGALDPITRAQLQDEFLRLRRRLNKTILFVTHDMDEAIRLGDRIAVMREGRIVQFDTPLKVLRSPADEFVRDLVGRESGQKLMRLSRVGDIMDMPVRAVQSNETCARAREIMALAGADLLCVTDRDGGFAGVVRHESTDGSGAVEAVMERSIVTVRTTDGIRPALESLLRSGQAWLPVQDGDGRLAGIVTGTRFAGFFAVEGAGTDGT